MRYARWLTLSLAGLFAGSVWGVPFVCSDAEWMLNIRWLLAMLLLMLPVALQLYAGLRILWWNWIVCIVFSLNVMIGSVLASVWMEQALNKGFWSPAWLLYLTVLIINIGAWMMGRAIPSRRVREEEISNSVQDDGLL